MSFGAKKLLLGLACAAWMSLAASISFAGAQPDLQVGAQAEGAVWNAVVVSGDRIFLSGPRWTGTKLPSLVVIGKDGMPAPYPDAAWNAWKASTDPSNAFVNINALHMDNQGDLWVVDTGSPDFGGDPLPHGAKLIHIGLKTNKVVRVYAFEPGVVKPGSYVDDVRFHGTHAYLTDAGQGGLIVLDLKTGHARRVLDAAPSVVANGERPIVVAGNTVLGPDDKPLQVNSDPLELSPDGRWFYFGTLEGPWHRVPTTLLDDPAVSPEKLAAAVEPWIDLPPVGGTTMDKNGTLYFSDFATNSVRKRTADGVITTLLQDDRLHWVDASFLDANGTLWMPAAQIDRTALFHHGKDEVKQPMTLYKLVGVASPGSQIRSP